MQLSRSVFGQLIRLPRTVLWRGPLEGVFLSLIPGAPAIVSTVHADCESICNRHAGTYAEARSSISMPGRLLFYNKDGTTVASHTKYVDLLHLVFKIIGVDVSVLLNGNTQSVSHCMPILRRDHVGTKIGGNQSNPRE